jgi:hypothetical protein
MFLFCLRLLGHFFSFIATCNVFLRQILFFKYSNYFASKRSFFVLERHAENFVNGCIQQQTTFCHRLLNVRNNQGRNLDLESGGSNSLFILSLLPLPSPPLIHARPLSSSPVSFPYFSIPTPLSSPLFVWGNFLTCQMLVGEFYSLFLSQSHAPE